MAESIIDHLFLIILLPFLVMGGYYVVILRRQAAFRELAATLGGQYVARGSFRIGYIKGQWRGRDYIVASDARLTSVFMVCDNTGIPFSVSKGFFAPFPTWSCANAIGTRRERIFWTNVTRHRVTVPLPEAYRPHMQRLFQESSDAFKDSPRQLKNGTLWVLQRRMEYRCLGFLAKPEAIKQALTYLEGLGVRIKFMPVR